MTRRTRIAIAAAMSLVATAGAQAASVDTAGWSVVPDVGRPGCNAGSFTGLGGPSATASGNDCLSLVSDEVFGGAYAFTGTMRSTGSDDDNMGVHFGYVDAANNYRMGWEWAGANGGFGDISGARGFWIVRESAGVSTTLFEAGTFWAPGKLYAFSVSVDGSGIDFSLFNRTDGAPVIDGSVMVGGSKAGRVGVYVESQSAVFGELAVSTPAAIPVPAALPMLAAGLGGLVLLRRRARR